VSLAVFAIAETAIAQFGKQSAKPGAPPKRTVAARRDVAIVAEPR